MAGTVIGGAKARETNLKNDPDHYRRIGAIGGKRSKRGHKFIKHENGVNYYTCNITGQVRKYREV